LANTWPSQLTAIGQKRPLIAIKPLAINSGKSIMEKTAHAQSHPRRHGCFAYLKQAFIPPTYGDLL